MTSQSQVGKKGYHGQPCGKLVGQKSTTVFQSTFGKTLILILDNMKN